MILTGTINKDKNDFNIFLFGREEGSVFAQIYLLISFIIFYKNMIQFLFFPRNTDYRWRIKCEWVWGCRYKTWSGLVKVTISYQIPYQESITILSSTCLSGKIKWRYNVFWKDNVLLIIQHNVLSLKLSSSVWIPLCYPTLDYFHWIIRQCLLSSELSIFV